MFSNCVRKWYMEYKYERHENWCYQDDVINLLSLLLRWLFWARYKELKWNLVVLQFWIWIESETKTGGVYRIDYVSRRSSDVFSRSFTLGLGARLDFKRRSSFRKYACYLSHRHQPTSPNTSRSFYHVPGYCWFLLWLNLSPNIFHSRILPAMWSRTPTDLLRLLGFHVVD